ncbi:MAG: hypothetical protein JSU96_02675, partial [Acidobacteriota bacterium]
MPKKLSGVLLPIVLTSATFFTDLFGHQIWLQPDKPRTTVGNWATAVNTSNFSLAVPDNWVAFQGSQVIVMGMQDRRIHYTVCASLSQDGAQQGALTGCVEDQPLTLVKDQLVAVDVSPVFLQSPFPPLAPGHLLSVRFEATADSRIVGMTV